MILCLKLKQFMKVRPNLFLANQPSPHQNFLLCLMFDLSSGLATTTAWHMKLINSISTYMEHLMTLVSLAKLRLFCLLGVSLLRTSKLNSTEEQKNILPLFEGQWNSICIFNTKNILSCFFDQHNTCNFHCEYGTGMILQSLTLFRLVWWMFYKQLRTWDRNNIEPY